MNCQIVITNYQFHGDFSHALVGLSGVEPLTSRLSGVRSNHLSYRPVWIYICSQRTFSNVTRLRVETLFKNKKYARGSIFWVTKKLS